MEKKYQVFVPGKEGKKVAVDISHSETEFNKMTISKFKKKLQEELPDPFAGDNVVRLLFGNSQLEDENTFSDYQIKHRSTILWVLRLAGGGGPKPGTEEDQEQKEPLDHCGNTLQTVVCTAAKPAFHQKIKKNERKNTLNPCYVFH
ncbi:uncharacterized protein LOC144491366 [Mustelus asterias]